MTIKWNFKVFLQKVATVTPIYGAYVAVGPLMAAELPQEQRDTTRRP